MNKLLAAGFEDVIGGITPPPALEGLTNKGGAGGISLFLSNAIGLIYAAATVIFVFMVIFSAVQWILSAGDKEKVGAARSRLTYAIIGIVILALSFVILNLIGTVTGFTFFSGQRPFTPPPDNCLIHPRDPGCF